MRFVAFHKVFHLPDVGGRFAAGPGAGRNDIPVELRSDRCGTGIIHKQVRKALRDFCSTRCHHNARGVTVCVNQYVSPAWVCGSLARDNLTGVCISTAGNAFIDFLEGQWFVGHQDIRSRLYISAHAFIVFDAEQGFQVKTRMSVKGRLPRGEPLKFPQGDPGTPGNLCRRVGPAGHKILGDFGCVVIVTVGPEIIILDDILRCLLTCQ